MAKLLMIKPASGDSSAAIFSDANSSSEILDNVNTGTMLKVVGSSGNFYNVEYDNHIPDVLTGGTEMTGTVVAYPSISMYSDLSKSTVIGTINNGTPCEILEDLHPIMLKISAETTDGLQSGYVEMKYVYCDKESEEIATFAMRRTVTYNTRTTKTIDELAKEVIAGKWGNGSDRKNRLTAAGYDYSAVQSRVNELMGKSSSSSSTTKTGTVVKCSSLLNVRSGPSTSYSKVGTIKLGEKVTIYETRSGWHKISNTEERWVSGNYIQVDGTNTQASVSKTDGTIVSDSSSGSSSSDGDDWSSYFATYSDSVFTAGDEYYRVLADKYSYALGSPPKYNKDIDVRYTENITSGTGRVVNKTILSNPAILSICPGKVKMFPNLFGTEQSSAFTAIKEAASGNSKLLEKITDQDPGRFSGRLYRFTADTAEYAKYLNALCRAVALMLGIGDELMPNTTTKLKNFDYAYWTVRKSYSPDAAASSDSDKSIFRAFWDGLVKVGHKIESAAMDDTTYINFFLNGNETTISESMTTSVSEGPLSGLMSEISSIGAKLNYFTNSGFDSSDSDVIDAINSVFGTEGGVVDGLMTLASNFMKGGRMVLPKMVEGSQYDRTISCSMRFVSPYGHKYAVFLNCLVPLCHIIAMAFPRQLSDNMYQYPFLVKCAQIGNFTCDLGVINNVTITRGGQDETSWTIDTLSTEWDVQIEIVPLVNELMITSSSHPVLFCQNEMLLSYLSNFCGFDMLANNLETKVEMMTRFIDNRILDIPHSIDNKISDTLYNTLHKYFELSW